MSPPSPTLKDRADQATDQAADQAAGRAATTAEPGLLLVYSGGQPVFRPLPLHNQPLEVGRGDGTSAMPVDPRMSRRHARVSHDGQRFLIEDLNSQNGTFVDCAMVRPTLASSSARVLRTGQSLFLLCPDVRPYASGIVQVSERRVVGPILRQTFDQITRAAPFTTTLHISGESGVGKEVAARVFHAAGSPGDRAFVAVNCSTIPEGVAERVLFGAKRGAFSGAVADSEGYLQAADGGTLFLDEIADLDLTVQAKLLRVLETHEVCPLGATRSRTIQLRLCSATNRDLRAEVAAGRFRADLYFRISSPTVELPPLRRRLEEIPWLINHELLASRSGLTTTTLFIELCLLRFWPGNTRELLAAVRAAIPQALAAPEQSLETRHLPATAGLAFTAPVAEPAAAVAPPKPRTPSREAVEAALRQHHGNVSAAARELHLHRNQLQRIIDRLEIEVGRFAPAPRERACGKDRGEA